jgi:hypothetical protein
MKLAFSLLTAFLLAPLGVLHAAEYFVGTRGLQTNPGTSQQAPFATIQKGVSMLKAGDTLTILPGEYREAVEMRKVAGASDAPITIRAQRRGTVLLRGDVEVDGWEPAAGSEGVFAVSFQKTVQGVADPRTITHYEPSATLPELGTKPHAFFQDVATGRLLVRTPDARKPGVLSVSITNGSGLALSDCAHVIVEGLSFTGYQHADNSAQLGSRTRWGFIANRCEAISVKHCVAYLSSGGFCLAAGTRDSVIEECEAFGNTSRTVGISNQILGWSVQIASSAATESKVSTARPAARIRSLFTATAAIATCWRTMWPSAAVTWTRATRNMCA